MVKPKKRRQRLKKKLLDYYGEKLLLLPRHTDIPDVIIDASHFSDQFSYEGWLWPSFYNCSRYIRSGIDNYCNNLPPLNWPPTIEELMKSKRLSPTSVILFLKNLLKHSKYTVSAKKWYYLNHTHQILFMESKMVKFWLWKISYRLKTGKSVDFKKTLPYSFSPVALNICKPDGSRRHTASSKLKDILLQVLEDHTYERPQSLREYAIVVDMIALPFLTNHQHTLNWRIIPKMYCKRLRKSWHNSWLLQGEVN